MNRPVSKYCRIPILLAAVTLSVDDVTMMCLRLRPYLGNSGGGSDYLVGTVL